MRTSSILALTLLATAGPSSAQTNCRTLVFPGNVPPSPWTAAGSPYCVVSNVTVSTPLTIQAGVEIQVHGAFAFTAGVLTVNGTAQQPVVFRAGAAATPWSGLVLQAAGSSLTHCHVHDATASGVQIQAVDVTLRNCLVQRNRSASGGGGIRVTPPATPGTIAIIETWILDNTTTGWGGGISASLPPGVTLQITDSHIARNRTNPSRAGGDYRGGGVYASGGGAIELTRSVVSDNSTVSVCSSCNVSTTGGGLLLDVAQQRLRHCVVRGNLAEVSSVGSWSHSGAYGGGLHVGGSASTVEIDNTLIACNRSNGGNVSHGGGIYVSGGTVTLTHTTLAKNQATNWWQPSNNIATGSALAVGGGTVNGSDCILYYNTVNNGSGRAVLGTAGLTYSCVQGGYNGNGNFDRVPIFADASGCGCAELIITASSPCVDAGDPAIANNDAQPPGLGQARGDMGFAGGPLAGGWLRAPGPFHLAIHPAATPTPATVTLEGTGALAGDPVAVLLVGIENRPRGPFWLDLFGVACLGGIWMRDLTLPALTPTSLEFQAVTLSNGVIRVTPQASLVIR